MGFVVRNDINVNAINRVWYNNAACVYDGAVQSGYDDLAQTYDGHESLLTARKQSAVLIIDRRQSETANGLIAGFVAVRGLEVASAFVRQRGRPQAESCEGVIWIVVSQCY